MNWALHVHQRRYDELLQKYIDEGMPVAVAARKAEHEAQLELDRYWDEKMDEDRLR